MKIIAFGVSYSKESINKCFAGYAARSRFPRHGAEIFGTFSLPYFKENFNPESGILDHELDNQFKLLSHSTKKVTDQIV